MSTNNPILARFQNNEPVLADEHSHVLINACAHQAALIMTRIDAAPDKPVMADDFWYDESDWRAVYRPYIVRDGVLLIPVKGVLLNDFGYALGNWATGYQYIWRAFERGMGDLNVRGIALVCDTPGGMVAGNFELVDKMYAMRGVKPIAGFAHESAYSAGYSIISAADPGSITVSRTGGVGSIGVVTSHVDLSKMMEQDGIAVTFIHAGKHKVDGNPYEALAPEVKARIQKRIDYLYGIFVSTVARNRDMDEQAVRETEALTFGAPEALSNGLADKIGGFDDALADFSASLNPQEGDETMADLTQADIDTAVAAATQNHEAALANARAEGAAEGATAERTRINAILASDAGKERPKAALSAALKTGMDLDTATTFLAELPKEAPGATAENGKGKDRFDAAMDGTDNPDMTDGGQGEERSEQDADAAFLQDSFGARKPKRAA